jgi:hypothetical protein
MKVPNRPIMRRLNSTVKLNGTAIYQILRLYNTFVPNDLDNNGDLSGLQANK